MLNFLNQNANVNQTNILESKSCGKILDPNYGVQQLTIKIEKNPA